MIFVLTQLLRGLEIQEHKVKFSIIQIVGIWLRINRLKKLFDSDVTDQINHLLTTTVIFVVVLDCQFKTPSMKVVKLNLQVQMEHHHLLINTTTKQADFVIRSVSSNMARNSQQYQKQE